METLFDVWPWSIRGEPDFLFFSFVAALVALWGGWLLGEVVARVRELPRGTKITRPDAGTAYRAPPPEHHLAIGTLPEPEDAWPIAYLRAGERGLAETLAAAAIASGFCTADAPRPVDPPDDPLLFALYEEIGGRTASFRDIRVGASRVAARHAGAIRSVLVRSKLWRTRETKRGMSAILGVAGGLVLATDLVRCERLSAMHRSFALLVVEMLVIAVMTSVLVRVVGRTRSAAGEKYLDWLGGVTSSARADVRAGRSTRVPEVTRAVAIDGIDMMTLSPYFVAVVPNAGFWQASRGG